MTGNDYTSNAYIIKDFISKVFSIKWIYVACVALCLGIAFFINRISPTVYEVNSIIGPIEDGRSVLAGSNNLFRGLEVLERQNNLEDDINNAKSFSLVAATLNKMDLEVGYYNKDFGLFGKAHQIYPDPPFRVRIDKSHIQPINTKFEIDFIDRNSYRLTSSAEDVSLYNYVDNRVISDENTIKIDTICRFNETVNSPYFKFAVSLNNNFDISESKDRDYYFEFYHLDNLARNYLDNITVKPVSLRSSLINVSFQGQNIDLTIDFINRYLQTFLDDNLSKKNKISLNAINFIDTQISEISDSLNISESKLKDFRSANKVMDLSFQGQRAFEQMNQIETDRTNLQIQERYYNYLLEYFDKNKDMTGLAPPSAANVVDPIMNSLILDLLELNSQRSSIVSNNAEKNLFLGQIDNKIRLQKQAIIENVKNNLNTLTLTKNELNYRAEKLSREITQMPRTELNMVGMQRKFNLGSEIYTFLLQRRSEAAITMASNYPDFEILEPAREITREIISPKTMMNWMLALFIAMILPTAYLLIKEFFNETITSVGEIENILKRSVLSVIFNNPYKTDSVVVESPGSPIAESFRTLRSSLFIRFKADPLKLVMVTSSQPQDGKSFVSFNLAASIASVGHRTVLIDGDLRRPNLHANFKIQNTKGITNLIADNATRDQIIHKTHIENLSFIPAGPVLANSSELVEAGALDDLISYLKDSFDFIIIDTSPAGLVADAALMMKYASLVLLVCRINYTRKDVFNDVLGMFRTNMIKNFDVVVNDLNIKKSKYGHYSKYYNKETKLK